MNSSDKSASQSNGSDDDDGKDRCQIPFSVLINPGNPSLSGVSKFSYFPVGGPEPPPSFEIGKDSHPIMGYVTSWGGLEVGKGMSFAANTVDGIVHQYGGKELRNECDAALSNTWTGEIGMLDEGKAISTQAVGQKLKEASGYDFLVHTVPPFVDEDYRLEDRKLISVEEMNDEDEIGKHNDVLLAECYRNSLRTAGLGSPPSSLLKIACPLLGAGCRGFPIERAIRIASSATTRWIIDAAEAEGSTPVNAGKTKLTNDNGNSTASMQSPFSRITKWFRGGNNNPSELVRDGEEMQGDTSHQSVTLAFGIPDGEIRNQLIKAIDREMGLQQMS